MDWDPDFLARSPMFEPLRPGAPTFGASWPELAELQRFLEAREPAVRNAGGTPLRLVAPARGETPGDRYEARVFLRGELQVRNRDWHDLFNVLAWLAFPRAKAALNARHYAEAEGRAAGNRGPVQDALTLFDEGGMIVASSDAGLLELLRGFRWKELFWRDRSAVRARMRFFLFGHALLEKALEPFDGITARGVLLQVPDETLAVPPAELLAGLDASTASVIADPGKLSATRDLSPVPVLGVPGWHAGNEREEYYDNTDYFRPGRRR